MYINGNPETSTWKKNILTLYTFIFETLYYSHFCQVPTSSWDSLLLNLSRLSRRDRLRWLHVDDCFPRGTKHRTRDHPKRRPNVSSDLWLRSEWVPNPHYSLELTSKNGSHVSSKILLRIHFPNPRGSGTRLPSLSFPSFPGSRVRGSCPLGLD